MEALDLPKADEDVARLMKHAHDLERRGRKMDAELTYNAASEIARMRQQHSWQPIATAPKDGTTIIVWCVHELAKYCEDPASEGYEAPAIARWIKHNGGGWTWHGLAGPPTLWMPLPPSPNPERRE